MTTVLVIVAIYIASLVGYNALDPPPRHFEFSESSVTGETAVIIRLRDVAAAENNLVVDVLVHPGDDLRTETADGATDLTVRLSSWTESGKLIYVHDDLVGNESEASLVAVGDPDTYPFDSYSTDDIGVALFAGEGPAQRRIPAPVVVSGSVNGWNVDGEVGTVGAPGDELQSVRFQMQRTRGALAVDVGILLVLLALPATALFVAIEMLRNRRKFQPPFITWFAAMLFAVVPLRGLLPGNPPAGAWIDLAIVIWVLTALASAMVIFVAAWWRQTRSEAGIETPPRKLDRK